MVGFRVGDGLLVRDCSPTGIRKKREAPGGGFAAVHIVLVALSSLYLQHFVLKDGDGDMRCIFPASPVLESAYS